MVAARFQDIVEQLADDIRSGALPSGARLPTHRALAERFRIATATASRVYAELRQRGVVVGEVGRGTLARHPDLPGMVDFSQNEEGGPLIDLSLNCPIEPGQEELLRRTLAALARERDLSGLLRYQPHPGRWRDRLVAAHWLTTADRALGPDEVLVVVGAQQ